MTDEEKQDMIDRLTDDFKAKKIAFEDLARVLEKVAENPLVQITGVMFVDQQYIQPSALNNDEKDIARLDL